MSDSDTGEKKAGVPTWQLKPNDEPSKEGEQAPESTSPPESTPPSRETIIEQAKKFLEEDDVRNASEDKKIAFLESKGLRQEEIQSLLGSAEDLDASSTQPPRIIHESPPSSKQAPSKPQQTQNSPPPPSQPPIITYPEFLTTPPSPSPLITKTRLLTTLYAFSFLSALTYGTNTYLLSPMLATLTNSRLSLHSTAQTNLSKLLTKLENAVSTIPTTYNHKVAERDREDSTSEDEDPTEMFHRDIGVQTSLPSSPLSRPTTPAQESVLENQQSVLKTLKLRLEHLLEDSTSEGHDVVELETGIEVLKEYLEELTFSNVPTYNYGFGGSVGEDKKRAEDEIDRARKEVKSMKGVLLSARSFPGGVRGAVR